MKKYFISFGVFFLVISSFAQVGISTTTPNPSSVLDVVSSNSGVLIPRISLTSSTDTTTISNGNVESLLVYNTQTISDITPGYYYWDNTKWQRLLNGMSANWSLNGNAGTDQDVNFLGTTDDMGLAFRTNNNKTGFISNDGLALHFGINAGLGGSFDRTVFLGEASGSNASGSNINAIGVSAALGSFAFNSNFIGEEAGLDGVFMLSNVFGKQAGVSNYETRDSNFLGFQAGYELLEINDANFFGNQAGYRARSASNSNFLGKSSGYGARDAFDSTFLGRQSGYNAAHASHSIFIGYRSGYNDTVNNTIDDLHGYSILLGRETSTGGFGKSIAIGGSATNTASNQMMIGSNESPIHNVVVKGKGGITLPLGTTTERPGSPDFGTLRYNTDIGRAEVYVNDINGDGTQGDSGWRAI